VTLRWAFAELYGPRLIVIGLAAGAAVALVVAPAAALALVAVVCAAVVLPRVRPQHFVAAVLVYLPFENQALTYAPQGWAPFIRYAPEVLIDLALILVLVTNPNRVFTRLGKVRWPLAFLLAAWVASVVWSGVALSTASIGFRSELRFLPLLLLAALSTRPSEDGRLYGRAVVIVAGIEAAIIALQAFAGAPARDAFAPDWSIEINGVAFADAGFTKPDTNFGTFSNYNTAGIFLVFAWILLAAAGARRLGLPSRIGLLLGSGIAAAILLSGSRESGLALAVAALVIVHVRFRRWVPTLVVVSAVALLIGGPILMAERYGIPSGEVNGRSITERWAYVMSPSAWSTNYHDNFRLFLLQENAKLVADTSPVFGFGIGSVSDKRTTLDGTNPLYRTWAGRRALQFSYLYDGQWGLLIMEVGFLGLLALAVVFAALARLALKLLRVHWLALALLTELAVILVLGFFATVLQLRLPTAILWLTAGLCLGLLYQREEGKVSTAAEGIPRA
jgi:hypothetical protein